MIEAFAASRDLCSVARMMADGTWRGFPLPRRFATMPRHHTPPAAGPPAATQNLDPDNMDRSFHGRRAFITAFAPRLRHGIVARATGLDATLALGDMAEPAAHLRMEP